MIVVCICCQLSGDRFSKKNDSTKVGSANS